MTLEQVIEVNVQLAKNALGNKEPAKALNHLNHILECVMAEGSNIPPEVMNLRLNAYRVGESLALRGVEVERKNWNYQTAETLKDLAIIFGNLAYYEITLLNGYIMDALFGDAQESLVKAREASERTHVDFTLFSNGVELVFNYVTSRL